MMATGIWRSPAWAGRFRVGIVLAVMPTAAGLAQQPAKRLHLRLDPAATTVQFSLKDTLHAVHGSFHLSGGDILFDPRSGDAQGKFEVETASGASGNDSRDSRMKKEFLEVTRFPVATFEAQKVIAQSGAGFDESAPSQTISVAGVLTLHGASHPMTLQFAVQRNGTQATAATRFTIPYVSWGIKDPSIPFVHVEKEVTIDVTAKGTLTAE